MIASMICRIYASTCSGGQFIKSLKSSLPPLCRINARPSYMQQFKLKKHILSIIQYFLPSIGSKQRRWSKSSAQPECCRPCQVGPFPLGTRMQLDFQAIRTASAPELHGWPPSTRNRSTWARSFAPNSWGSFLQSRDYSNELNHQKTIRSDKINISEPRLHLPIFSKIWLIFTGSSPAPPAAPNWALLLMVSISIYNSKLNFK